MIAAFAVITAAALAGHGPQAAHDNRESKVVARTAELRSTAALLREEVEVRKMVEADLRVTQRGGAEPDVEVLDNLLGNAIDAVAASPQRRLQIKAGVADKVEGLGAERCQAAGHDGC